MPWFLSAGSFSARDGEGRELFADVSVELVEGELAVLEGPSGGGKSTLLRNVVGMLPTGGATRELAGEGFPPHQLPRWRSKVTLLAQDAPMLAGTVGENLRFPFSHRCAGGRAVDDARLSDLLDAAGLGKIPGDRDIGTLSGGERHRLALVRGLLWDPPVLVADEPLSGLDEEAARSCFALLAKFARRSGHSVLVVLHDRVLGRLADRLLRLRAAGIEVVE